MPRDQRLYMTFPIDIHRHPKLRRLAPDVRWTFIEMNGEARLEENDGVFTIEDAEFNWPVEHLAALTTSHPTRPLVIRTDTSYVIRDYAEHQFTKADRDALTEKRARAGRASADARRARAEHVFNTDQQDATGKEREIGKPSSKEEGALSPFCSRHPQGTDQPCKACGTARLAYEAALKAEKNKPSPAVKRPATCTVHAEYPLPCSRCAEGT